MLRCVFTIFAVVLLSSSAWAQAKLRVAIEGEYPPFSATAADGTLSGFDIDLAEAVCEVMQRECELIKSKFDTMIVDLNANKFDLIVASMTITDERKKGADFSDFYYNVPARWIAKYGTITDPTPANLRGQTIAVLRNSPRARWLLDRFKDSEVLQVAKETDVYMMLVAGRATVGFSSATVSAESFLRRPEGQTFTAISAPVRVSPTGVGIAIRKGDTAMKDSVNAALRQIRADGTYDKMQKKYFDFDISGR